MKKLLMMLCLLSLLAACGSSAEQETPAVSGEIAVPKFDTLEAFEAALFAPPNNIPTVNYELAAMDTMDKYFVPNALPEGYVLHRIDAGRNYVCFEYIPADAEDPDVARYTDCIEFAFSRESYGSGTDGVWIDAEHGRCCWVQDGSRLWLSKPTDRDLNPEELLPYCSAELVTVERCD